MPRAPAPPTVPVSLQIARRRSRSSARRAPAPGSMPPGWRSPARRTGSPGRGIDLLLNHQRHVAVLVDGRQHRELGPHVEILHHLVPRGTVGRQRAADRTNGRCEPTRNRASVLFDASSTGREMISTSPFDCAVRSIASMSPTQVHQADHQVAHPAAGERSFDRGVAPSPAAAPAGRRRGRTCGRAWPRR